MKPESHRDTIARVADAPDFLHPMPGPAPESGGALAALPPDGAVRGAATEDASPTPYIDTNGFDPDDYRWVPVRRSPRKDGFSEAKQRAFIELLADSGCVETAAQEVGMSARSCYRLRRAPGAENFARAWDAAIQQAALKLVDIAFDRAINGSDEPVFNREGRRVGRRQKPSDRLLMFLLRAHLPDCYRFAHHSNRQPGEPLPAPRPPLADAIARLEPMAPAAPHRLLPPDRLDAEVEVADLCDGELPPWYRHTREEAPVESPLGEAFERQLDAARGIVPRAEEDEELWDEEEPWDES
ncbi:hypothetical protein [Sphingomonas sp. M1-B02]|uniref:hypothetical protein n=1 Tax=Sphingomonas sp. M1-B02 TaxID=3114300 RepID=UPI0022409F74|nr:hypothetical protein [Sphingomonas sp. S6-11]UZK65506.1 hypothetical protein OKW87_13460 [Sphingomonas sp. S6-11]